MTGTSTVCQSESASQSQDGTAAMKLLMPEVVTAALEELKGGSSAGVDGMPAELYQQFPIFDTVRKAFGVVQREGGGGAVEPNRLLLEEQALSLQSTQGVVLWSALKAQWALRCEARFQGGQPSLDDFVARWMGILEVGRAEQTMSLSRPDLQQLLEQLFLWFGGGMFQKKDPAPGVFPNKTGVKPTDLKEQKWGRYRDAVVKRLKVLETERWTLVYTDGSAKQVRGWWQAGYGVWFGEAD